MKPTRDLLGNALRKYRVFTMANGGYLQVNIFIEEDDEAIYFYPLTGEIKETLPEPVKLNKYSISAGRFKIINFKELKGITKAIYISMRNLMLKDEKEEITLTSYTYELT